MEIINTGLISYCGFYCGACSKFKKGECLGCKGDEPKCAVGYTACMVRPCCTENGYDSCADCNKFVSVKYCKKYNPLLIKFGQFITGTNRRKAIEMIKEKGEEDFIKFMIEMDWVAMKNKIKH